MWKNFIFHKAVLRQHNINKTKPKPKNWHQRLPPHQTHLVRIFEARPSELNLKRDKFRKIQGETTWQKEAHKSGCLHQSFAYACNYIWIYIYNR